MTNESLHDDPSHDRLSEPIAEYLRAVDAGDKPDRREWLARYPNVATELEAFFRDQDRMHRVAEPLRVADGPAPVNSADAPTLAPDAYDGLPSPSSPSRVGDGLGSPSYRERTEPMTSEIGTPGSLGKVRYFGDYELLEEIARGGMGVVYKARQANLKRIVALKMILAGQLASNDDVKRFYAEAQAAAKLEHPNIVSIFEIRQAEGQHYFSMAFVEGESLAHRIARGVLTPAEAAKIMLKVARAIAFAHVEGVVHRDLKPANILLDTAGEPHVTDFGLAKRVGQAFQPDKSVAHEPRAHESVRLESLTYTGQILGTPSYMPPEQAGGRTKEIGPLADVYSLGAVLYCAITGRPPFQAASPLDTLMQVIEQDPVAPRLLNPAIPRDLETIVMKCLEKEPRRRYESAAELADDLQRFISDEPITARPPDALERAWRWVRKQRRSVALTAAAVAATLVVASAGLVTWVWYQDWRLGYIALDTDRPPIAAELLDEADRLVTKAFTVPTQEPVPVPAGEYRLRLSTAGRLSQTLRVSIDRGASTVPMRHKLNLEDQNLVSVLNVERSYAIVNRQGRADVVLLDGTGFRYPAWFGLGLVCGTYLIKPADGSAPKPDSGATDQAKPPATPALAIAPGLRWPWNVGESNPELTHAALAPMVVANSPDLDGDGVEDVVVAARHQAWIAAMPSRGGGLLWLVARGSDLTPDAANSQVGWYHRGNSAVLSEPLVVGDHDGDGAAELIAAFADQPAGQSDPPRRWIECLSGRTGKTVWRFDLQNELFALPSGVEWSESAKWITDVTGYSSGGGMSSDGNSFTRSARNWKAYSNSHPAPFPPQLVRVGGQLSLVVVAGTHVLGIDPVSGKSVWEPFNLSAHPVREPQFADLDGDGDAELIVLEATQGPAGAPLTSGLTPSGRGLKLSAWSMRRRAVVWLHDITADWGGRFSQNTPVGDWPVIEDIDGDGKSEVVVPTGSRLGVAAMGEIEVLSGTTGESRWRRLLRTMDQHVDRFIVGPDLNGDGQREVITATMVGRQYALYIDALSGKDGQTLWWSNRETGPRENYIASLHWWRPDGESAELGQLLARAVPEYVGLSPPAIHRFDLATGQFLGTTTGVDQARLGDVDGDGAADLITFQQNNAIDASVGGKLQAFRSDAPELWRRLGGVWTVGSDYDGDGQADLVTISERGFASIAAMSGSNGRRLWHTRIESWYLDAVRPLDADLDGDGTADVLAFRRATGNGSASGWRTQFPFEAISGRTGESLWSVEVPFSSIDGTLFTDARDWDGDGIPEVAFSTLTDWDYAHNISGSSRIQHWLAVVSGRTGEVRWRQPLSVAYGSPGAPANRNYDSRDVELSPSFADIDGDGVLDIILPAETADSPDRLELRALSGRDGKTLWRRPLAPPPSQNDTRGILQDAVGTLATDLDGDGKLDLLGLEYVVRQPTQLTDTSQPSQVQPSMATGQPKRHARAFALDAATGRELWATEIEVEDQCGIAASDPARQANKPRPLVVRTREGRSLICLGLWGWSKPGKLVLLDRTGKQVAEFPVTPTDGYYHFRPIIHDVDGDGNDDVLVVSDGKLQAIRVGGDSRVLWEWPIPQRSGREIVTVYPAAGSNPAVIAVQSGATLYGISGRDGKPVWINSGPQPMTASGSVLWTSISPLPAPTAVDPPRAVFQFGEQLTACRPARLLSLRASDGVPGVERSEPPAMPSSTPPHSSPQLGSRRLDPSHTIARGPDPRWVRRPGWAPEEGERARGARSTAWGVLVSLMVLVLPGWFALRAIQGRRFGMRTLIMLPVLAAVVLAVLQMPGPTNLDPASYSRPTGRLITAITFLPIPVFTVVLIRLAVARRWRLLLASCGVIVLFTGLTLLNFVLGDLRNLAPGERYLWTAWDVPLAYGYYASGWVATPVAGVLALVRSFRKPSGEPTGKAVITPP